jgi:hypothetical protein
MKTTARFIISAATGLGLAAFFLVAAFAAGANAPVTVIAFALLAIYGLLEIAILSYSTPRFVTRPVAVRRTPTLVTARGFARVPAIVEMPGRSMPRRAA